LRRKVLLLIIATLLALGTLGPLAPKAYAWTVLKYETCRSYDPKTFQCIEPTDNFTVNDEIWIHAEFDFRDIPKSVTFNSTSEWRNPRGNIVQHETFLWSGGSSHWLSNRNLRVSALTTGKWTVSYLLDGGPMGHNVRVFNCTFTIGPLDIDSSGYVSQTKLEVPYTNIPANVSSGVCKADQWQDALVMKTIPYRTNNPTITSAYFAEGYLLLKHDDTGLYGCIDMPSEKKPSSDGFMQLEFDTAHDGYPHSRVKNDDKSLVATVKFVVESTGAVAVEERSYTGNWMKGVYIAAATDYSPKIVCDRNGYSYSALNSCHISSQNTNTRNLMWTFSVPLESLSIDPSNPKEIGLYFQLTTSVTLIPMPYGWKVCLWLT
jgi:hypothetical protein